MMVLTSPSAPQGLLLLHPPFSAVDSKLLYHPLPFKVNLPHEGLLPKTHSAHEKEFLIGDLSFRKLAILTQRRDFRPFRFTENGSQKFFNVRSRNMGNSPMKPDTQYLTSPLYAIYFSMSRHRKRLVAPQRKQTVVLTLPRKHAKNQLGLTGRPMVGRGTLDPEI